MNRLLNKVRELPKGAKASIAFFFSTLCTKGIAYLTTPFYTRLLTTAEYGQVSVYLTWVQIFGIVAMFSFMNGVFNNGMVDFPNKRNEFTFSLLVLSNIITLAFGLVIFLIFPIIRKYLNMDYPLLILMFLIFLFQPAQSFWMARQRYELKYKLPLLISVSSALFSSLSAVICLFLINRNGVYERLFGAEVVLICFYLAFYIVVGIKNKWRINIEYWKYAILFNLPLIPHYLSTYLLSSSDKIMISRLVGDTEAGIYSIAVSIASIALIVWTAINASLVPFTYEKCKTGEYDKISRVTKPLLFVFSLGCIFVIMLAPEAVRLISTKDYLDAIYVIPPIVGGVFFQVQYYIYANIVYYHKKPIYVMIASVSATILNISLNYLLIPKLGYRAAGYTTIVSYCFQAAIDFLAMRKITKTNVYDIRYVLILSAFVTVTAVMAPLFYHISFLRYEIVSLILLFGLLSRKKIFKKVMGFKNE